MNSDSNSIPEFCFMNYQEPDSEEEEEVYYCGYRSDSRSDRSEWLSDIQVRSYTDEGAGVFKGLVGGKPLEERASMVGEMCPICQDVF